MAKSGEHRMLFDLRGRRKKVIQVAYAFLAAVMALSLFTVVGPVNLDSLIGGGGSSGSTNIYAGELQRLERQLKKDPNNPALLAQLTRTAYNAGSATVPTDSTGNPTGSITQEGVDDFNKSSEAWQRYLKTDPKKPDPLVAQFAALALIGSATLTDFQPKATAAANAQAIYAKAKPSANSYIYLAQYRFLAGDVAGGKEAGSKAIALAPSSSKSTAKQAVTQLQQQAAAIRKQAKSAQKAAGAAGKQALENPIGGLAGGGSGGSGSGLTPPP
jgi:hypothetical protein